MALVLLLFCSTRLLWCTRRGFLVLFRGLAQKAIVLQLSGFRWGALPQSGRLCGIANLWQLSPCEFFLSRSWPFWLSLFVTEARSNVTNRSRLVDLFESFGLSVPRIEAAAASLARS